MSNTLKAAKDRIKDRIKTAMRRAGLTQSELAKRIGLSQAAVSGWVKGKKMPTTENIKAMAKALDATPQWLAYGEGPGPKPDVAAAREAYQDLLDWVFRHAPADGGRDY